MNAWTTRTAYAEERLERLEISIAHYRYILSIEPDDDGAIDALSYAEEEQAELQDYLARCDRER